LQISGRIRDGFVAASTGLGLGSARRWKDLLITRLEARAG
jgi:hypothetical protein